MQPQRPLAVLLVGLLSVPTFPTSAAETAGPVQKITLEECIALALEKNLDVQISRRGPEISNYYLQSDYGAYDPNLRSGFNLNRNSQAQTINSQGQLLPAATFENIGLGDNGSFLQGNIPIGGMSYSIGFGFSHQNSTGTRIDPLTGLPLEIDTYNAGVGASVRQPLMRNFWTDGIRTTIELSEEDITGSELSLQQQLMTTVLSVEQAYYDLVFAREYIMVQQTALEASERLLNENRKRVEVGAMAPLEEKSAEAQAAASRASLIAAQGDYGTRMRVLKNLITDDYSPTRNVQLDPTEPLRAIPASPQIQDSWLKGLTLRPDLEQLRLNLRKKHIQIRYQKNQLWPVLDVVGSYGQSVSTDQNYGDAFAGIGEGRNPSYGIGLTFSVPLGNRTARNNLRASQVELEQALLTLKKQEQSIMVEIDNAIAVVRTDFERVGATRETREFAKDAWDAEQKKLDNGKSTSYEVLLKQRDYIRALSEEIQALTSYNKALANLSFLEGTILERHNLGIEVR